MIQVQIAKNENEANRMLEELEGRMGCRVLDIKLSTCGNEYVTQSILIVYEANYS